IRRVFSMLPEGMVNACTRKVRITRKSTRAMTPDLSHSSGPSFGPWARAARWTRDDPEGCCGSVRRAADPFTFVLPRNGAAPGSGAGRGLEYRPPSANPQPELAAAESYDP